jgi:hypothetical protein
MERMVMCRVGWFLESRNLRSKAQCGFRRHKSTFDYLVILEYHIEMPFNYASTVLLNSAAWKRRMTEPGGMEFSEAVTAGISGVHYHSFLIISSRPVISALDLGMLYALCLQCNGMLQKSDLCVTLFEIAISRVGNAGVPSVVNYYSPRFTVTIGTPATGRYKPSTSVGSGDRILVFPRQDQMCTFRMRQGFTPLSLPVSEEFLSSICTDG